MSDHDHVRTEDEDGELKNKRTSDPKLKSVEATEKLVDPGGTEHTGAIATSATGRTDRSNQLLEWIEATGGPVFVTVVSQSGNSTQNQIIAGITWNHTDAFDGNEVSVKRETNDSTSERDTVAVAQMIPEGYYYQVDSVNHAFDGETTAFEQTLG